MDILSTKIAHSITVMPCLNASSLTSLSLVGGVSLAIAFRWPTLRIPNLRNKGAMCTKDGSQLAKIASNWMVASDFILLIVDPDRVGWKGGKLGRSFSMGVDCL